MSKKEKTGWLATAPNAAQKIQEAQTAFGKMQETLARDASLPRRAEFPLYLNQFQNACYSVTISLDKKKNGWRKKLSQPERELINFMRHQRGTETHNAGAQDLRKETKWHSSFGHKDVEITLPPALYMTAGISTSTHAVGLTERYFETGRGRKEIIPTCAEYLAVLGCHI